MTIATPYPMITFSARRPVPVGSQVCEASEVLRPGSTHNGNGDIDNRLWLRALSADINRTDRVVDRVITGIKQVAIIRPIAEDLAFRILPGDGTAAPGGIIVGILIVRLALIRDVRGPGLRTVVGAVFRFLAVRRAVWTAAIALRTLG